MKKKQKEKFNLLLKRRFLTVIFGFLFFTGFPQLIYAKSGITPQLIEEAKILLDREKKLLNARINVDWETQYSLQHPNFRKKVSVEELEYFEGFVASDYREKSKQNAHISGSFVPNLNYIKQNQYKKDPLGFPVKRRYKWSDDSYLKIKSYSLRNIYISTDGKYAKVDMMLKGRQRLNPVLVRTNIEFDAQYPSVDYWEKINGNWVVTLLSTPVNTSGTGILNFLVPNNKSSWGKAEFVELNPADLELP
jgi:hypothetical protein